MSKVGRKTGCFMIRYPKSLSMSWHPGFRHECNSSAFISYESSGGEGVQVIKLGKQVGMVR